MNNLKSDIIKTVTAYNSYYESLSPVIKQYFEDKFYYWQQFDGWKFSNNGDSIIMYYSYEEFLSNAETYMESSFEIVPLDDILEYMQSQKTK